MATTGLGPPKFVATWRSTTADQVDALGARGGEENLFRARVTPLGGELARQYAKGAALSRRLGGWQVISWALALALPVMLVIAAATLPSGWSHIRLPAWLGLAYVSVFSMLVGFVFWYRGLARGGIAGLGQLQLWQPFFGLLLAGLLLHEPVAWSMIAVTGLVVLCVAGAKRFA